MATRGQLSLRPRDQQLQYRQIFVHPQVALAVLGKTSGFLNVRSSEGLVVHNLPLPAAFPYEQITTALKLPTTSGVRLTTLPAYVEFSDTPVTSFSGSASDAWPVGKDAFNAGGANGEIPPGTPLYPPPPNVVIVNPAVGVAFG